MVRNIHDSSLMKRYVNDLAKANREKWQLSEVDKAMANGAVMAAMPIAMMSVIWAVNELLAWLGKKKSKSRW